MTLLEKQLIDILKKLKAEYGLDGVKAEFEAEGSRLEEVIRLKEVAVRSGVTLTLKIGGCEAVRDMEDARSIGIENLVGPMIESPYSLSKFILSAESVFGEDEWDEINFLINIETIETINNLNDIYASDSFKKLDGIVVGRGDLVESLGLPRTSVDCDESLAHSKNAIQLAKKLGKLTVMGGNITTKSLDYIRSISADYLDKFETRKVCFLTKEALARKPEEGISLALDFELCWLENKRNHYSSISQEDMTRIEALYKRKSR